MSNRFALAIGVAALCTLALGACNERGSGAVASTRAGQISAAGSTFAAPIYQKWAAAYKAASGAALNYQAIGSGGGIRQIENRTVDFGATDKPLHQQELDKYGLVQFPTVLGGVVPIENLPGVKPGDLRLTGPVLADIYLGAIARWSDPRIAALNPGLRLADLPITVVHRSDGSGTTFIYTSYLAQVSPDWVSRVGASDSVAWPTGEGGKGSDGVTALVRQTPGAIGYVEYAYARQSSLAYALMRNHDGQFVAPTAANFAAAAAGADWAHAPGSYLLLIDQPGANAWPISGATFILLYKHQQNPAAGAAVLRFFDWGYANGDPTAARLDYVPLPGNVKALVRKTWGEVVGPDGKPIYVPAVS